MSRRSTTLRATGLAALLLLAIGAAPVLACGGLIGPNGAVNLLRTTTLAGYHDGEEHYVTAFQFAGGGGAFGSLTPLPGVPSKVEKGGDWTLQRLVRETEPVPEAAALRRRQPPATRPRCSCRSASTRSTSRSCGAVPTRSAAGPRTTASGSRRMRPRCSSSTPSGRRSSWRRCSTRMRPRSAARRSATARRSTSRSRPTTRGSRCGSSPSARPARSASTPTCTSSTTSGPRCSPHRPATTG